MADLDTLAEPTLVPTPNDCPLERRFSDFVTFGEALDYAARSAKGLNFHDPRGNLTRAYPYAELQADSLAAAWRLAAAGIAKGDRVALIAETGPEFAALFCGAILAGAWPVPLPLPTSFGAKDSYIEQIAVQLGSSDPQLLLYPLIDRLLRNRRGGRHETRERRRRCRDVLCQLRKGCLKTVLVHGHSS